MKVFSTCCLDNTMCEYAFSKGYTHLEFDSKIYEIVKSDEFGFDWVEQQGV